MDIGNFPFQEEVLGGYVVRYFDIEVDDDQLYWHKDEFDRLILVVVGEDWQLQLDNQLPVPLMEDMVYPIPKETFHRLIKGSTNLILKIKEL